MAGNTLIIWPRKAVPKSQLRQTFVVDSIVVKRFDRKKQSMRNQFLRQFIFVVASCFSVAATAADFSAVTVFQNGQDGYKIFRIPAMVAAANGDILAFCEARTGGDASEIDLVLKRSSDQGKTWQALEVVQENNDFRKLYEGTGKEISVGNPAPVVDLMDKQHPGRIWLPFTVENDRVFVTFSDDHGKTWAAPLDITASVKLKTWGWYATGPIHSIQLAQGAHQGRLVVPCDHRIGKAGQDKGVNGAHAVISDDHGQTWKLGAIDDTYDDGLNANETAVVELNDGRLYFNTRDQHGKAKGSRGEAYSSDGGTTFDRSQDADYKFFIPSADVLDPPVVQSSLLRVSSKADGDAQNLILFAGPDENGPTGKGRSDLRVRYSTDETKTWHDGPLLHNGPAAYSDMVRLPSKRIGVLFEAGDKPGKKYDRIVFTPIAVSDVTADH